MSYLTPSGTKEEWISDKYKQRLREFFKAVERSVPDEVLEEANVYPYSDRTILCLAGRSNKRFTKALKDNR